MDWDKRHETLVSLFLERVRHSGPAPVLIIRRGSRSPAWSDAERQAAQTTTSRAAAAQAPALTFPLASEYQAISWRQLADDARRTALALRELGLADGDRVAQVSGNRYLWVVIDLAIHLAGGAHVALHAELSPEQMTWQIRDSGARLAIGAAGNALFARAEELLGDMLSAGRLRLLTDDELASIAGGIDPVSYRAAATALDEAALKRTTGDRLATILYTSGTTGEPKGVMLSHNNLAFNALASVETFEVRPDDLRISWLPLSHIYARTSDLYLSIASGTPLALATRETLLADLAALRPTVINGVPYFYDRLARYLASQGLADTPGALATMLGGRMRFCCSGGAALGDATCQFFARQGVLLVQGYGLTESSPVITTGRPDDHRLGTVGPPIPGVEVAIAPDGEVLTRGPHVMLGYWRRPDETAATIHDGWLHTGDLGEMVDGHLRIVGRKKELIVLSSGKKVAPASLERLLESDPLISRAMLIGEGRKFLTALIVPDLDVLRAMLAAQRAAATDCAPSNAASTSPDVECPLDDPTVPELFAQRIAGRLATAAQWEQTPKFVLTSRPLSIERGELTPTLKLRREVVERHFSAEIEQMYADDPAGAPCSLPPPSNPQ